MMIYDDFVFHSHTFYIQRIFHLFFYLPQLEPILADNPSDIAQVSTPNGSYSQPIYGRKYWDAFFFLKNEPPTPINLKKFMKILIPKKQKFIHNI